MRVPSYVAGRGLGFNMTPMIDVVFLLIIFFLVSSHMARNENRLELPLPIAATGEDDSETDAPRVTVNLRDTGAVMIAGHNVEPSELTVRLQAIREQKGDAVEVRIRADRTVPYEHVSPVLLAAAKASVWNVTFAVVRAEDR